MLRELTKDLWVVERPLRFGGVEVGTRMSVIRLHSGELFLHSPVALDESLHDELARRGRVRYAVAPNRFHHLSIAEYAAAFPGVRLFAAPGLERKRSDVRWDGILTDGASPGWGDEIRHLAFQGFPLANEVVFLHAPSRTLLLTDLAFNLGSDSPALTRLLFRLIGGYGRFGPSLLERLGIRDRAAARTSLEQILGWDFDRVIVAHGHVLERGGRQALRAGYSWLLG